MAESYAFSLLGVMDSLWFYKSIFFTENPSVLCPKPLESLQYSPIQNSQTSLIPGNDSSSTVDEITSQDDHEDEDEDEEEEEARQNESTTKERLTRLDLADCKSPSVDRICKSLGELELEEVKGFMDLGFIFEKERTSKKMMSVLPGLQRLQLIKTKPDRVLGRNSQRTDRDSGHEDEDDVMERGRVRPYLSEAWLIKSPNSPLLNLRMPRPSAAADMKKHLRHWAKTVATVIRQES